MPLPPALSRPQCYSVSERVDDRAEANGSNMPLASNSDFLFELVGVSRSMPDKDSGRVVFPAQFASFTARVNHPGQENKPTKEHCAQDTDNHRHHVRTGVQQDSREGADDPSEESARDSADVENEEYKDDLEQCFHRLSGDTQTFAHVAGSVGNGSARSQLSDRVLQDLCQSTQSRHVGRSFCRIGGLLNGPRHLLELFPFALA